MEARGARERRKPRSAGSPRSAGAPGARKDGKVKTSLLIDPTRLHLLSQLASHLRRSQSDVVLDALDAYMARFKLIRWLRAEADDVVAGDEPPIPSPTPLGDDVDATAA